MLKINELREKHNVLQKELADYLGVARNTYSQYETGKRDPDYETIKRLAAFFSVSVDYLIGYSENESSDTLKLSADEKATITAYRNSSNDDKAVVDAVLRKYKENIKQDSDLETASEIFNLEKQDVLTRTKNKS